ncbi:hypothetical protein ACFW1M_35820 [Streptomyces inhibens]|uniref:hypothetical protein n=1 Tax=Streptomyces inhibens TaxID=2293571 RepID=UPI0036C4C971
MFDRRAEAEMRLYSEKLARELALKRHREEGSEHNIDTQTTSPADEGHAAAEATATADAERVG